MNQQMLLEKFMGVTIRAVAFSRLQYGICDSVASERLPAFRKSSVARRGFSALRRLQKVKTAIFSLDRKLFKLVAKNMELVGKRSYVWLSILYSVFQTEGEL